MQDLLEQFDPLSINTTTNNNNNYHRKPLQPPTTTNTRSSSNAAPLFSSNYQNNTTTTTQVNNQKWIIKPPTDSLSSNDQDPLGFLNTNSPTEPNNKLVKHKPSDLFTQAQIRSKLRQEALAKHLAHEPFKPTSPAPSLQNDPTNPTLDPTPQPPLINLLDPETVTCLAPIPTSPPPPLTPINPPSITSSPLTPEPINHNSIKIPAELFQNRSNKVKKLPSDPKVPTRPEPRITRPLDEHKLAAALLEGFDDFVSAPPPNQSSSSLQSPPRINNPVQSFNSSSHSLSPTNNINNHLDSCRHSTPLSSFEGPEGIPNPIHFIGVHPQSQTVMDDELAEGIRLNLPNRLKISSEWKLIYSIDQDGSSLSTLYSKLNETTRGGTCDSTRAGFILVLRDQLGRRFGGFVNEPFRPSKEYYGSGECFLWKAVEFGPDDFRIGVAIKAYNWTGINDYMILSDHDLLSIGGGDGKFGLWIDSNLLKGSSTKCPAFNNDVLCSSSDDGDTSFDVIALECWMVSA